MLGGLKLLCFYLPTVILLLSEQVTPPSSPSRSLASVRLHRAVNSTYCAHYVCFSSRARWISSIPRWQTKHSIEWWLCLRHFYICFFTLLHNWLSKWSMFSPEKEGVYTVVSAAGGAADRGMITVFIETVLAHVNSCKGCVQGSTWHCQSRSSLAIQVRLVMIQTIQNNTLKCIDIQ